MSTRPKQIECLIRLETLTNVIPEMLQFLMEERLIVKGQADQIKASPTKAKDLQALLASLSVNEKLQLLEYNWTVLPAEIINITLVTDQTKREFTYTAF